MAKKAHPGLFYGDGLGEGDLGAAALRPEFPGPPARQVGIVQVKGPAGQGAALRDGEAGGKAASVVLRKGVLTDVVQAAQIAAPLPAVQTPSPPPTPAPADHGTRAVAILTISLPLAFLLKSPWSRLQPGNTGPGGPPSFPAPAPGPAICLQLGAVVLRPLPDLQCREHTVRFEVHHGQAVCRLEATVHHALEEDFLPRRRGGS